MLALALALIATTTTGSGVTKTEHRPLDAFTSVSASGSISVDVVKGDALSADVTADDNIVALVVTDVKNGVLSVHIKDGESVSTKVNIVVKVSAKTLEAVESTGSGKTTVTDVPAKALALASSGSGALVWKGPADVVTAKLSGSGAVTLIGKATTLDAALSGSGALDASAFEIGEATVAVTGSGKALVNATAQLKANVTGSGKIIYAGSPRVVKRITGSGNIIAKDAPTERTHAAAGGGW